jgi:site-specific recombinase XerD
MVDARKECRAVRHALDKDADPSIDREKRKGADTFQALAEGYLATYAREKRSKSETERILKLEWYPVIGAMKAEEVPRLIISRHLASIIVKRNAPVAANRALAAIGGVYRWALSSGRLETIPVIGMKRPATEKPRSRSLSQDEIAKLWDRLPSCPITDDL